jgi:hypothetical protein
LSISLEITRLQNAKSDIKTSIENKGVTVGEGTIDTYASKIDQISTEKPEQIKTVTPTAEGLTVLPDTGKVLSKIVINGDSDLIASNVKKDIRIFDVTGTLEEGITPSGSLAITENGSYDVTNYASANVNVPTGESEYFTETIKPQLQNNYPGFLESIKKLPDNLIVEGDSCYYMFAYFPTNNLPQMDTSNVVNMERMFWKASGLTNVNFPYNLSNVTNLVHAFNSCSNMESISFTGNANKVTSINSILSGCSKLTTVNFSFLSEAPLTNVGLIFYHCSKLTDIDLSILNANLVTNVQSMFSGCYELKNLKGLVNMGKGYDTTKAANYYEYTFDVSPCTKLTEVSLIHILNNAYDIATKGCTAQTIKLGSTNKAKLTSTEGQAALAQATSYGWTVS